MGRFEDSPELFGGGLGHGLSGSVLCEWCGKTHHVSEDEVSMSITDFAGKQVAGCCFAEIEAEVLHRMPDILRWFTRITDKRRAVVERDSSLLVEAGRNL